MINYVFRPKRMIRGRKQTARLYSGRYRLDSEVRITEVPLKTSDKQVAEKKLNEIIREREREAAGIIAPKPIREAAKRDLRSHLEEFVERLLVLGRANKYVKNLRGRVSKLITECAWLYLADVSAEKFERWRVKQRGKAAKTLNEYLDAANAFLNWMVSAQRTPINPLDSVKKVDTRGRQIRLRRAFTDDEVRRLLMNAGKSKIGYLFAVHTGLRRSELRALTWADINLDPERPSVSIVAGTAKNRTAVTLPLNAELVAELRAIKPLNVCGTDKVLVGRMLAGMWKMKSDLKKAGIRFI
jgi:integrase